MGAGTRSGTRVTMVNSANLEKREASHFVMYIMYTFVIFGKIVSFLISL